MTNREVNLGVHSDVCMNCRFGAEFGRFLDSVEQQAATQATKEVTGTQGNLNGINSGRILVLTCIAAKNAHCVAFEGDATPETCPKLKLLELGLKTYGEELSDVNAFYGLVRTIIENTQTS